ncbi:MAG: glycosyltransferase family 2 protein [Clostridiales bacterium]|nr:glycosyltransferase family 2 protein [Clostridiales bacterium]
MNKNSKTLIIIPAYNEAETLERVIDDISKNAADCDCIIINDCSTDGTLQLCRRKGWRVANLTNNLGIGGAMQTGYKYAAQNNYDIAIQFDGDGQHEAKYIHDLIDKIQAGADLAIGSRYLSDSAEGFKSTATRRLGIKYFSVLIKLLTGKKCTDPTSGLRACSKAVINMFASNYPQDYPEPDTIVRVARQGLDIIDIPVSMQERVSGKSSITCLKSIYYAIKVTLACLLG